MREVRDGLAYVRVIAPVPGRIQAVRLAASVQFKYSDRGLDHAAAIEPMLPNKPRELSRGKRSAVLNGRRRDGSVVRWSENSCAREYQWPSGAASTVRRSGSRRAACRQTSVA
jgi:hypothetical protein